jgi:hypothetical protein
VCVCVCVCVEVLHSVAEVQRVVCRPAPNSAMYAFTSDCRWAWPACWLVVTTILPSNLTVGSLRKFKAKKIHTSLIFQMLEFFFFVIFS